MRTRCAALLAVFFVICIGHANGAFDEAEWRKAYDHPKVKEASAIWLNPGPEQEKFAREEASTWGTLPKDPARAEKYIKQYVAFESSFYSTVYKHAKIDSQLARQVLANPDFGEDDVKRDACLLLYIDSGDVSYLKRYLLSNEYSPKLFLRVHDPAVVKVAMEIVGEAYKERMDNWNDPTQGKNAKIVAAALPAFAGMMYVQDGGNLSVAKALFRDIWVFSAALGMRALVASVDTARTLQSEAPERALRDFLYTQYEQCDDQSLANIKRNATPELAKIVDEVGERYRDDVKKMLDKVNAVKPAARLRNGDATGRAPVPTSVSPSTKSTLD